MTRLKCGRTMSGSMARRYAAREFPMIKEWRYVTVGADRCCSLERQLVSICRSILGDPTRGKEWFIPPNKAERAEILERFDELVKFSESETE